MNAFKRNNEIYISQVEEHGLKLYISKVYGWTFIGLLMTAITVFGLIQGLAVAPNIFVPILENSLIISVVQFVVVIIFSSRIHRMRPFTAKFMYLFYSISMGVFFSWIVLTVNADIIIQAFAITAVSFGAMSLYGITTNKNLMSFGNILLTCLIGLVIASVVNIFLGNSMLDMIISVSGVFIFLAFTVYDSAKIRHLYYSSLSPDGQATALTSNLAIYSALSLYLNFINIMLFVLRLLQSNRR